jgi:nascent polypeptide-associated complex subunit alpha
MMPGNMNPRQMKQMMKRLGIKVTEIKNVEKIVITTDDKEYVFKDAEVTVMDAHGQKTYQITGSPEVFEKEEEGIPEEDINLIVEQTGVSKEEAEKALEESDGDIAEAILKLQK